MRKNTYQLLSEELGVSPKVLDRIEQAESEASLTALMILWLIISIKC